MDTTTFDCGTAGFGCCAVGGFGCGAVGAAAAAAVCGLLGAAAGRLGRSALLRLSRGVRPPAGWCEFGTAALWAVAAVRSFLPGASWWWLPVPLVLAWFGVLLGVCDVRAGRLPDALTLPLYPVLGLLLGGASLAAGRPRLAATAALGCVLCGGVYLLVRLVLGDALGPGDVKLAGALGAAVGGVSLQAVAGMVVVSAVLTALLARLLRRRDQGRDARDRSEQVPAEQARAEQPGEQQPQGAPERQGRPEMARGVPHGPALLGPAWLLTALGP